VTAWPHVRRTALSRASTTPTHLHDHSRGTVQMTSPCPQRSRSALTRTGALAVVFGIALAPTAAYAQDSSAPTTVRALIAGDGSVSSIERLPDGEAPSKEDIPVTLDISQSSEGDVTTTSYTVENTSTQTTSVEYLDAEGVTQTVEQEISLPLVAQLAVRLPASRTDVEASGARITKLSDGSTELVWSLVLFNPIGSPTADVSFSAKGKGEPLARLDTAAVVPNATPGLSATAQAANATVNGNGILNTVGIGANEGLTKLSEGVGKLIDGLDKLQAGAVQLNGGLVTAADGAEQLAVGGVAAKTGAADLTAGAVKLDAGAGKISDGLGSALTGSKQLAAGGAELAPGAASAAVGANTLSEGLALISAGLNDLSGAAGLPAALVGAQQLQAGVDALRAGLGAPATEGTILNGVTKISGGLALLVAPEGLPAAKAGVDAIKAGIDNEILPGLGQPTVAGQTVRYAVDQVRLGLNEATKDGGSIDKAKGALALASAKIAEAKAELDCVTEKAACDALDVAAAIIAGVSDGMTDSDTSLTSAGAALQGAGDGLTKIVKGLDNADPDDPKFPGISQGLGFISGTPSNGPDQPGADAAATGLSKAIEGINLLRAGVDGVPNPQNGNKVDNGLTFGLNSIANGLDYLPDPVPPAAPVADIAGGLDALVAGLTRAVTGTNQLATGAGSAATGSVALAAGTQKIADGAATIGAGNTSLSSGLQQLYTGSQDLKAGTGALAAGAGKLATGVGTIADGNRKLADGLPTAADGSGTIAEGLTTVLEGEKTVGDGIGAVNTNAVQVLQSQFKQGTVLARQQLAGLDAASAMIDSTPGAANTSWVLTQSKGDISANLVSGESNTGRNIALGAGAAALLLAGVAGGFVGGRRAGA
jgi:putative membrane protein